MTSLLPCSAIVYRAAVRKSDIRRGVIAVKLFMRRAQTVDGLSVDHSCSPRESGAGLQKFGVVSLHVGRVRNMNLDVIPDSPIHANITGLPMKDEDKAMAEWLAGQLADHARIVADEQWKNPGN